MYSDTLSKLDNIRDRALTLKYTITYNGHDPDRPTTEETVAELCDMLIDLIDIQKDL